MKRLSIVAVVLGALGLATAIVLWSLPAGDFILTPDKAKPLAGRVVVEGSRPGGAGDVYYVDLYVRRVRLLEHLLPFTRPEGSTVLPEHALLPPGTSDEERDRQNAADMERSERIASVVALRALGYDVVATPRGALVIGVASDVPAAEKLDAGDVIVAVDDVPVRTPADLRREIGRRKPGDDVRLTVRRRREAGRADRTHRSQSDRSQPGRSSESRSIRRPTSSCRSTSTSTSVVSAALRPGLPFALEIARKLGRDVTHGCKIAATGELALDGTVLPIGGIEQKTIGARRADVDFFVVPVGRNAEDAQEHAGGLEVIPVESFQQAFRLLTTSRCKVLTLQVLSPRLTTGANCGRFRPGGGCLPRTRSQECWLVGEGATSDIWRRSEQRSPATTATSGAKDCARWRETSRAPRFGRRPRAV